MNTKKSKNKSKSKPIQHQESENIVSENVIQTESVEKLEDIIKEGNKEQDISIDDNHLIDDIPKKPKRTKGRKKNDTFVDEDKKNELFKSPKHQELEETDNNYPEKCIQEVPSVRKKKNKHKKQNSQPIGDEDASSPLVELLDEKDALKEDTIAPSVHIIPTNTETTETKEATKQKKKKKKKIRLDSDKSDKIETQNSCTLAFQKLLQSSDQCNQETSDSETISRAPVDVMDKTTEPTTEAITKTPGLLSDNCEVKPIKELIKDESPKTLDKNKKGKKQPPTKSVKIESIQQPESVIAKDNIVAKDNTNLKEDSPKPRAQIAKPVEKRGKAKRKLQESDNESVSSSLIKADENLKVSDTMQSEKVHPEDNNIIPASIESVNIINKQEKHKEIKKFEELISESSECSLKKRDDEQFEIGLEADNSDFVKVKTGKNKKKKNKDIENHFVADTGRPNLENLTILDNVNVLSEQTKPYTIESGGNDTVTPDYIVAPDFIDYPRSVSQMVVDNNNNTIIQEITTPEEIKLGIPIFTTVPIIQGSGESPEAQNNKLDDKTNVTEIELKTANSPIEKTDIKSKMIEVNRDMEELRRSIERSLAGFTNIENSDSNIEKEFEEIFQSSKQESEAIEIPDVIKEYGSERLNDDANIKDKTSNEKTAKDNSQTTSEVRDESQENVLDVQTIVPVCPARKDKGKGKSKKKSKQDISRTSSTSVNTVQAATKSQDAGSTQETRNEEKSTQKTDTSEEKCKKQTEEVNDNSKSDIQDKKKKLNLDLSFEPIENFEDALTSSVDDINKTFELIANDTNEITNTFQYQNNPEINITAPVEDTEQEEKQKEEERRKEKQTPVSQPKNLLGQTDIPAQSNKVDYKKEKNKTPNNIKAKVKIKDSNDIEEKKKDLVKKERREGEVSDNIQKFGAPSNNTNEEFIYKYNFRKVFLQSLCHLCNNDIVHRVPCQFCSIVFYCSAKHKDEDWPQHQPLCFAISTLAHLKDQKHIYADAKNIKGQEYRVLRMQMILSCERILKRKLVPWEQEAMLYPRICADVGCREWRQRKLTDCRACGQISYCSDHPEHLPPTHQRWCKPYSLYKKLVTYHQKFGKLEPRLPTKVLECYQMSDNINEVLGSMYEEKIDISDIQYASLTQMASAALTAVYSYQLFTRKLHSPLTNGIAKRSTLTVHSIGSDMQSEADSLNKWEIFFLHLTDIKELRVIFIDPDLNKSNLPLDLLAKIKLCENCRSNKRRVVFNFEDKKNYQEYYSSDEFVDPNIVCIFNSNIQRSSIYSNRDNWPSTINCILRQKVPFLVTSYTLEELKQDLGYIKRLSKTDFNVISEPKYNPFSSVRPDRNFITDHDMPLLFKNYCFSILCGA